MSLNDGREPPVLKAVAVVVDGLSNEGKLYLLSSLTGSLFSFLNVLCVDCFVLAYVVELYELSFDFDSSCCFNLYLSLLIKFSIYFGLILFAMKYKGCLFFRYSIISLVSLSAFNCLSFIFL